MCSMSERNILLLVEGAKTELKLFKRMLACFPEINLRQENIIVYNTNIWALNGSMVKAFGEDWYTSDDIDFLEYIESIFDDVRGKRLRIYF